MTGRETITDRERRQVDILVACEEITVTWSRFATGERGPDLHVHREHTDAFYVLEGELAFELGPQRARSTLPAGGFAAVPALVAHGFANESGADARWLNLHAPDAGFAAFLRGMRDGLDVGFDSFAVPDDGGLPASAVTLAGPPDGERALRELLAASLPAGVAGAVWDALPVPAP